MYTTLRYYRRSIIGFTLCPILFTLLLIVAPSKTVWTYVGFAIVVGIFGIAPIAYNLHRLMTLRRQCALHTPERGTVIDWTLRHSPKASHGLVIRQGERTLETPRIFSTLQAPKCVGHEIEFAELDGYIFVYRIL